MNWSTAKILVTGGHGFLGSHLLESLRAKGCTKIFAPARAECDLRDEPSVRTLFRSDYDLVFHLAASVGGIGANRAHPADFFRDNMLMGIHTIDAATKAGVGRFVLLGTICAYPKFAPVPFAESSLWDGYPEETNAPYGVAKRSLLVAAEGYRQQYGLRYTAIFPTNLYGPRDDFDLETSHVIPALIRKCEEARRRNEPTVQLWGTGDPSRDFLYVKDAVTGLLLAADCPEAEGQFFNLSLEREIKIRDLARVVADATGFKGTFAWDSSKPDGQPRRYVSSAAARKVLGFRTKYSLEDGIEETIRWYRDEFKSN